MADFLIPNSRGRQARDLRRGPGPVHAQHGDALQPQPAARRPHRREARPAPGAARPQA